MKKTAIALGLAASVTAAEAGPFTKDAMYAMHEFASQVTKICQQRFIQPPECKELSQEFGNEFGAKAEYICREVPEETKLQCMNDALVITIAEDGSEKLEAIQGQDL